MRWRAIGTEIEHGLYIPEVHEKYETDSETSVQEAYEEQETFLYNHLPSEYLRNGGRIYPDCFHPEASSPECRHLWELVVYERAMGRILLDLIPNSRIFKHGEAYKVSTNDSEKINSFGYHENYQIPELKNYNESKSKAMITNLIPHLLSRIVFTGSGSTLRGHYLISPRVPFISTILGGRTTNRGLSYFKIPGIGKDVRMHLTAGEANMSEVATFLKLGTTSIILDMIENGWKPPTQPNNFLSAFANFNKDITLKSTVPTNNGDYTIIDFQEELLGEVIKYREKHPEICQNPEGKEVIMHWIALLEDLKTDPELARNRVDWVLKYFGVQKMMEELKVEMDDERIRGIDLEYHQIGSDSIRRVAEQTDILQRISSDEEVNYGKKHPPNYTRASARGTLIGKLDGKIADVSWSKVKWQDKKKFRRKKLRVETLNITDPLNDYKNEVDAIISKFIG